MNHHLRSHATKSALSRLHQIDPAQADLTQKDLTQQDHQVIHNEPKVKVKAEVFQK